MKTSAMMALSFVFGAVVGATAMALFNKRNGKTEEQELEETTRPEPDEPMLVEHSEEAVDVEAEEVSITPMVITKVDGEHTSDKSEEYAAMIKRYGGTSESAKAIGPYVISEEDLNEYDDYGTVFLTYYADGVLADDLGVKVDDIDEVVGNKFVNYFGAFGQPDLVCIRNDERKCDYHIAKSLDKWATVDSESPHMKWR